MNILAGWHDLFVPRIELTDLPVGTRGEGWDVYATLGEAKRQLLLDLAQYRNSIANAAYEIRHTTRKELSE